MPAAGGGLRRAGRAVRDRPDSARRGVSRLLSRSRGGDHRPVRRLRHGDRPRDRRRTLRLVARVPRARDRASGRAGRRRHPLVGPGGRGGLAAAPGTGSAARRGRTSGHAGELERCRRLLRRRRRPPAHRRRMGARGAGRPRGQPLPLGRPLAVRRRAGGEPVRRSLPWPSGSRGQLRRTRPRRVVPPEPVRPLGHGRQRLGMGGRRRPRRPASQGGSFLCAENSCQGYRIAWENRATADSAWDHTGFRCAF